MRKQRNGRTRQERLNADNLKSQRRQPCARCGQAIDYGAPTGDPDSFIAGHIKAWINHPEHRADPGNLQPEHEKCGKSAGADDGGTLLNGKTSRSW